TSLCLEARRFDHCVDRFLLGSVDEAAGIDDDDFSFGQIRGVLGGIIGELREVSFAVDGVLVATERDDADFHSIARTRGRAGAASTVVPELELDAEVLPAKERHSLLEIVPRRGGDAHLVALDRRLNLFELGLLDGRCDFLRGVPIKSQLESDVTTDGVASGRFDLSRIEILHGDATLYELGLKGIPERLHLIVVLRGEGDLPLGAIELDGSRGSLEVVALGNLLLRLIYGVVDLLEVD